MLIFTLVFRQDGVVRRYNLTPGEHWLGRDETCQLVLPFEGVSRQHARIRCTLDGCTIADNRSTNGTLLNNQALEPGNWQRLNNGDRLAIGTAQLLFRMLQSTDPPVAVAPVAPDEKPSAPVTTNQSAPGSRPMNQNGRSGGEPSRPRLPTQADGYSDPSYRLRAIPERLSRYMVFLPEVYHTRYPHAFFNRFLHIFESVLAPIEYQVASLRSYFDARTASPEMLEWMETWLRLAAAPHLDLAQRRMLIQRAPELYAWRGTRYGLSEYLAICTGLTPTIIEPDQSVPGMDPLPSNVFLVILETASPDLVDRSLVRLIIDSAKPAHTAYYLQIRPPALSS